MNEKARLPVDPVDENLVTEPDWQKIEAEYRAGKSLRAISELYGVGKDAISRKANRERWQKGATDARQGPDEAATSDPDSTVVAPTSDASLRFDWDSDGIVVLHEQPLTALYFNPNGALVIRQYAHPDFDPFVVIAPEYFESFLEKLTSIIGIPPVGRE